MIRKPPLRHKAFHLLFSQRLLPERSFVVDCRTSTVSFHSISSPWNKYSSHRGEGEDFTKNAVSRFFSLFLSFPKRVRCQKKAETYLYLVPASIVPCRVYFTINMYSFLTAIMVKSALNSSSIVLISLFGVTKKLESGSAVSPLEV